MSLGCEVGVNHDHHDQAEDVGVRMEDEYTKEIIMKEAKNYDPPGMLVVLVVAFAPARICGLQYPLENFTPPALIDWLITVVAFTPPSHTSQIAGGRSELAILVVVVALVESGAGTQKSESEPHLRGDGSWRLQRLGENGVNGDVTS